MRSSLIALSLLMAAPIIVERAAGQEFLQQGDFLTDLEINAIREAQEPNLRITTYLEFASLRVELVRQLLEKEESGRGAKVHKNLDEYGRIMEAIDMVIDDALLRDIKVAEAVEPLTANQEVFLERLEGFEDDDPDDLWRYQFVLMDAIEITADSVELAEEGLDDRKRAILDADRAEKIAREESMAAGRRKEVAKVRARQSAKEETIKSKRPTLLGEGETLDDINTRPSNKTRKRDK